MVRFISVGLCVASTLLVLTISQMKPLATKAGPVRPHICYAQKRLFLGMHKLNRQNNKHDTDSKSVFSVYKIDNNQVICDHVNSERSHVNQLFISTWAIEKLNNKIF